MPFRCWRTHHDLDGIDIDCWYWRIRRSSRHCCCCRCSWRCSCRCPCRRFVIVTWKNGVNYNWIYHMRIDRCYVGVTKIKLTLSLPSDVMWAPICAPNWEAMLIPLTGEVGGPFLLKNFFRSHSKENILWKDRRNLEVKKLYWYVINIKVARWNIVI